MNETSLAETTNLLEAAIRYSKRGFKVLPLHWPVKNSNGTFVCSCKKPDCKNIGKHPLTLHGKNDATDDEEKIKSEFEQEISNPS